MLSTKFALRGFRVLLLPYFLSDLEYVERLFWPNENFEKSNQAWKISWKKNDLIGKY